MDPDDVTEEIHRKYTYLYHLIPSKFAHSFERMDLKFRIITQITNILKSVCFFMDGDIVKSDVMELVNTLYTQARDKKIEGLTPSYALFTVDLEKLDSGFRFFL